MLKRFQYLLQCLLSMPITHADNLRPFTEAESNLARVRIEHETATAEAKRQTDAAHAREHAAKRDAEEAEKAWGGLLTHSH